MHEARREVNAVVAAAVGVSATFVTGCVFWQPSAPPLFVPGQTVEQVDFEGDALNRPPSGFEAPAKGWTVADSPTAASGFQVLVREGAEASDLKIANAIGSRRVGGEVSLRILLGSSGSGIGCGTGKTESYIVVLEPETRRLALYHQTDATRTLVASSPVGDTKGSWSRLGIRCEPSFVAAYLGGKPVARTRASMAAVIDLALHADGGVVAQFDDLKYAARK